MSKDDPSKMPVNVASEPWVMEKLMDTENRIEKAFHEQTRYLDQKFDTAMRTANERYDQNQRWMIGLTITIVVTLIAGMFFQYFG